MRITESYLRGLVQEELRNVLRETYASDRGAEAAFFADQPGEWMETPVEEQPELEFIYSAATEEEKEAFTLEFAELLQAYDTAAAGWNPLAKRKALKAVKDAWLEFKRR